MTLSSSHSTISGEDLSDLKRHVLEASRKLLVENVDAPRFLPYFRSRFILDQRECDQIKSCSRQSRYDGAEKLLDALLTKGGDGYDHFCSAIMYDRTQMFLLTALNKKLELLREWRKTQVAVDLQQQQAQVELQQRIQAQVSRQQLCVNHTHPMMTATAYSGIRYHQPLHPLAASAATGRLHLPTYQQHHPERLARSPIPPEEPEIEAMAPPTNAEFPHPHQLQGDYYPQFTDHQHQLVQHQAQLPHHSHPHHSQQQVYHHPSTHPSATQPLHPVPGGGYSSNYPPQHLHGHYGCVSPPAPVEAVYPVPMEGGAYHEPHIHHSDILTQNTPTGAMMDNLLPGPPPTGSASTCATAQAMPPPATGYGLMSSGTAPNCGGSTKDILCGQGGN